jgi:hypothetical protein
MTETSPAGTVGAVKVSGPRWRLGLLRPFPKRQMKGSLGTPPTLLYAFACPSSNPLTRLLLDSRACCSPRWPTWTARLWCS